MEDLVQRLQQGMDLGPGPLLILSAATAAAVCLVLPALPWFHALAVNPPTDNPCHVDGRKSKVGGIAIVMATLLAAALVSGTASPWRALPIYLGGLFLVGLLDDLHPLTPGWKIILQIPMAMFVVLSIPRSGWVHLGLPWVLLQVGWIVVITNAYNIVDVADGLLAGLTIPALALLGGLHLASGVNDIGVLSLALSGALFGFLFSNASPGRVMLGDSGSLPVGGLIAFLVLIEPSGVSGLSSLLWTIPATGVVIFEAFWVSVRRIRLGIPPWKGSPHHLVYWIIDQGLALPSAVLLLAAVQTLLLLPIAWITGTWWWLALAASVLLLLSTAPHLRRRRVAS